MEEKMKILIKEDEINKRIEEIADEISNDYLGEEIILLCVLKGAVYFAIDLSKKIKNNNVILDFVKVSSYVGKSQNSTGTIEMQLDISENIENKNVIIVEDILDTGRTLEYLIEHLKQKKPKTLKLSVLLDKKGRREKDINSDYTCFEIDNKFVIGYGLDYDEKYRNLPYIAYIDD